MASAWQDEVSPSYLREDRIDLTLDASNADPAAFQSLLINVSYTRALPQGVMLPLILEVIGPSSTSYQRREFTRSAPNTLIITPREGGAHRVILREVAHNRWFGRLSLQVAGELLEAETPV